MSTFITSMDASGTGPTVAVKDLVDVIGVPTTAGSPAVALDAEPASADAEIVARLRARDCRLIGKTNLHELAFGTTGVNDWSGTPRNPLDGARVPGGSSSGSAVAVGAGDAELAIGSDTGGSIRIPAAFCGVCGLKTTYGRLPLDGVWPLAPSLDTVGPMAANVDGLVALMAMLEPGFQIEVPPATRVGRLRLAGEEIDPRIDDAVDAALAGAEFEVVDLAIPEWTQAWIDCSDLLVAEAFDQNRTLLDDPRRAAMLSAAVRSRLEAGGQITASRRNEARAAQAAWRSTLDAAFERVEVLALPCVGLFPPLLEEAARHSYNRLTNPVNFAGVPALAQPVPSAHRLPAGLQLVGPAGADELLLATGRVVEAASGWRADR